MLKRAAAIEAQVEDCPQLDKVGVANLKVNLNCQQFLNCMERVYRGCKEMIVMILAVFFWVLRDLRRYW